MKPKYLHMIRQIKSSGPKEWTVYILRCQDGTLYTGIAKNAEIRFKQHQMGKGAAYTRIHPPQKIVFQEKGLTRSEALVREAALKRLPKSKKETLTRNVPRP